MRNIHDVLREADNAALRPKDNQPKLEPNKKLKAGLTAGQRLRSEFENQLDQPTPDPNNIENVPPPAGGIKPIRLKKQTFADKRVGRKILDNFKPDPKNNDRLNRLNDIVGKSFEPNSKQKLQAMERIYKQGENIYNIDDRLLDVLDGSKNINYSNEMHGDFVQKISDYLSDNADYYDERGGNIEHLKKFVQSQSFGKTFDTGDLNDYYENVFEKAFEENSVRNSEKDFFETMDFDFKNSIFDAFDQFDSIDGFKEVYMDGIGENPFDDKLEIVEELFLSALHRSPEGYEQLNGPGRQKVILDALLNGKVDGVDLSKAESVQDFSLLDEYKKIIDGLHYKDEDMNSSFNEVKDKYKELVNRFGTNNYLNYDLDDKQIYEDLMNIVGEERARDLMGQEISNQDYDTFESLWEGSNELFEDGLVDRINNINDTYLTQDDFERMTGDNDAVEKLSGFFDNKSIDDALEDIGYSNALSEFVYNGENFEEYGTHTTFNLQEGPWGANNLRNITSLESDLEAAGLTLDDLSHQTYVEWGENIDYDDAEDSFRDKYPNIQPYDRNGEITDKFQLFANQLAAFDALSTWRNYIKNAEQGTVFYNTPIGGGTGNNMREVLYGKMGFGKDEGGQFGVLGPDGKVHPINDYTDEEKRQMKLDRQKERAERRKNTPKSGPLGALRSQLRNIDDRVRAAQPEFNDKLDAKVNQARNQMNRPQPSAPTEIDRSRAYANQELENISYMKYRDSDGNEYNMDYSGNLTNTETGERLEIPSDFRRLPDGTYRRGAKPLDINN